ncbi:transglutaminase domain-containing protein [Rhodococcus sp. NPDC056743]|uniref:transglutaminase domain-containing protein n=1 Tax=Rhodococcus sp. NPDC056743 TaxID=3345934 RepID=UPI00366D6F9A
MYGLDDTQPASTTLRRGRGSCSQRLAVLEALARRRGIATRVEGLILRGEFW